MVTIDQKTLRVSKGLPEILDYTYDISDPNQTVHIKEIDTHITFSLLKVLPKSFMSHSNYCFLSYVPEMFPLRLRTRKPGDQIIPYGSSKKTTLKRYFINQKIPKLIRDSKFLLTKGADILWVPGYHTSALYKARKDVSVLKVEVRQ